MKPPKWISLKDAVAFVAKHVYGDEREQRAAKKRVRERIRYANKREILHRIDTAHDAKFNGYDFFQWVANEWPELRKAVSIDHIAKPPTGNLNLETFTADGTVTVYPSDPEELKKRFSQCLDEIKLKDAKIERLRIIESKWNEHLEEKERRRRKSSESGKNGGRGKTL